MRPRDDDPERLPRRTNPAAQLAGLGLFAPVDDRRPLWLRNPQTAIEQDFAAFHRLNPAVYAELEARALRLHARGVRRIGIAMLFEVLRYSQLETTGEEFKLNNSHRALYSRLLVHHHPELRDVIELRERREEGAA